jgi:hypothetical protein
MSRLQTTILALAAAALCWCARDAAAATPQEQAAARAMFDEGKTLAAQGKYAQACPKFEESHKIEPGVGTQFHLADCYENIGKTASAWALFLDAASKSRDSGQADREKVLRQRASQLEPKLAKLTIIVPEVSDVSGLSIARDGAAVGRGMWGTAVPVDPGRHVVVATAAGRKRWVSTVTVDKSGALTVSIPALAEGADETPPPDVKATPVDKPEETKTEVVSSKGSVQRTLGIVIGGVGLVGLGAATYFGVTSKSKMDDSGKYCDGDVCREQAGLDLRHDAVAFQTAAYVSAGVGAAALIGGVVLFVTAPKDEPTKAASRSTTLSVIPGGVMLSGRF